MQTQCISDQLHFKAFDGRRVVAGFDGCLVMSNVGELLLRKADRVVALIDRVVACFTDGCNQGDIVHTVRTLVGQRTIGIALGYEDVNIHLPTGAPDQAVWHLALDRLPRLIS